MKTSVLKVLAVTVVVLAVVFGCNTVLNESADHGSGDGFATLDSEFSNAPASPGGAGAPGAPGTDPGDDVELPAEQTRSFFTAFQIDPVAEDTAGPKFVVSGDVDRDGLLDLVSGWNQSQPIQLHLQRRDAGGAISFRTINLGGTTPIAVIAGVELGQINGDEFPDIVVLVKASGLTTFCPTCQGNSDPSELGALDGQILVLFNPAAPELITDGDRWTETALVNSFVSERNSTGHKHFPGNAFKDIEESKTKPEWSGFTSLAVADIDGLAGDEIVVAINPAACDTFGQQPPLNTVDLWINPGFAKAEIAAPCAPPAGAMCLTEWGPPLTIMADAPQVKDIAIYDVDGDADRDVVATYTNSLSLNVRWARNPLAEQGAAAVVSGGNDGSGDICVGGFNDGLSCTGDPTICLGLPGTEDDGCCTPTDWRFITDSWQIRPVGQIDTAADILSIGDVDHDGFNDVVVRSTEGQVVQWFRRPNVLTVPPEFPPNDPLPDRFNFPWPVFTLTEFSEQEPEAISLGDVTGDGQIELMVAVEGGVFWYDATVGQSVYDPWFSNTIIQDGPTETTDPNAAPSTPGGTGVGVTAVDASTHINALLVVDLDGDGKNDIIGTLDRRSGSGLSDDRLVWYRNTKTDEP